MAEPEPTKEAAAPIATALGPAVLNASQIMLAVNDAEIQLLLGTGRQALGPAGPVALAQEWTHAFGLSPTTATKLLAGLEKALGQYEKRFGKIPIDPEFATKMAEIPGN